MTYLCIKSSKNGDLNYGQYYEILDINDKWCKVLNSNKYEWWYALDHFYNESEIRDMRLNQLGIE